MKAACLWLLALQCARARLDCSDPDRDPYPELWTGDPHARRSSPGRSRAADRSAWSRGRSRCSPGACGDRLAPHADLRRHCVRRFGGSGADRNEDGRPFGGYVVPERSWARRSPAASRTRSRCHGSIWALRRTCSPPRSSRRARPAAAANDSLGAWLLDRLDLVLDPSMPRCRRSASGSARARTVLRHAAAQHVRLVRDRFSRSSPRGRQLGVLI